MRLHLSSTIISLHRYPSTSIREHVDRGLSERGHRSRLRREVISAVSPQRFPHSTLISSNNVSQTSQLFRKDGCWKEVSKRGKMVKNTPPLPPFHSSSTPLISLFSLSSPESDYADLIVFEEFFYIVYILPYRRTCQTLELSQHFSTPNHRRWKKKVA